MRGWLLEALLSLVESSAGQLMHARTAEELAEEEQAWQARLAVEFGAAGDAVRAESVCFLFTPLPCFSRDKRP